MKIAIRCDGGNNIGMGHIMRTLNLAKKLAESNEVFYICKINKSSNNKYKEGIAKVKQSGFNVKLIDEENFYSELIRIEADCLITDSYDVDKYYFDFTKKLFDKTIYIDDMNLFKFNTDYVINQNIGAEKLNYIGNKDTKFLLGAKYLMLREEFRNLPKKVISKKVKDILITVGGGDSLSLTEKLIGYIKNSDYIYHVVIGPSFDKEYIERLNYKKTKNIIFYENADMCALMQKSDLAISACGSTLYELAICGVPILGIIIADNQIKLAENFNNAGIIKKLGWYNELDKEFFVDSLVNLSNNYHLRKSMTDKAYNLVDGKGVQRIIEKIFK